MSKAAEGSKSTRPVGMFLTGYFGYHSLNDHFWLIWPRSFAAMCDFIRLATDINMTLAKKFIPGTGR